MGHGNREHNYWPLDVKVILILWFICVQTNPCMAMQPMSYSDFNVETNCWLPEKRLLWMCPHDRGFTSATSGCGFLSMGQVKQSHTAVCHGDPHFLHQRFFLHRRKGSSTSSSNQLVKYLHIFTQCRCRHILPRIWRWFQPCFCQSQAKSRNRVFSRGPS